MSKSQLPTYVDFMLPVLTALKQSGGSGRRGEIIDTVTESEGLSSEQRELEYDQTRAPIVADRIGWALSYLKKIGAVENSRRGVWSMTNLGRDIDSRMEIDEKLKQLSANRPNNHAPDFVQNSPQPELESTDNSGLDSADDETDNSSWQETLLGHLRQMRPAAFERLTQRLLREAGFNDVEVLGRSGDGGLDGVGIYRVSLVSFTVFFQCKRYSGSVGASAIRDFRGAMAGRGEQGLLVTTGNFTTDARKEAGRDGAQPIQLIDGEDFCDLLKEHSLGVITHTREIEEIEFEFFSQFD